MNEDGLEFREEVVFPDGAVYKGQLRTGTDIRHGFGIQIWPDGAKYEGNWRNNVASGRGKFHHIDGDIYDGNIILILDIHICGTSNVAVYHSSSSYLSHRLNPGHFNCGARHYHHYHHY